MSRLYPPKHSDTHKPGGSDSITGVWPPNGWSDDGGSPAIVDAGTGNLVNLHWLQTGPNGSGETTTLTEGAIDVEQGGTGAFFQVDANSGTDGSGHKIASVRVFMLHASDFLEVRNTSNNVRFKILANGAILMPGLPTSDPGVSGQLWKNSGVLTVSP